MLLIGKPNNRDYLHSLALHESPTAIYLPLNNAAFYNVHFLADPHDRRGIMLPRVGADVGRVPSCFKLPPPRRSSHVAVACHRDRDYPIDKGCHHTAKPTNHI